MKGRAEQAISNGDAAVELRRISVTYRRGDIEVPAVRGVSLTIRQGDFIAIQGPSGSGKSSLLRTIAGLCPVSDGEVLVEGVPLSARTDSELAVLRRRRIGFVHQLFNLLPDLSARDNVALPLQLDRVPGAEVDERVWVAMKSLGIESMASRLPEELSGGEMLRVALARALVIAPAIILADEPTGSLDRENGNSVLELFRHMHRKMGTTLVVVTHDDTVAAAAEQRFEMEDGRLRPRSTPKDGVQ